jgi:hypothetical protein
VLAITSFAQGSDYRFLILGEKCMTTIMTTFGRLLISAPLLVLFVVTSTVANAESRIGTAQTVKPDASGSVAA